VVDTAQKIHDEGPQVTRLSDGRYLEYIEFLPDGTPKYDFLVLFIPGFGLTANYLTDLMTPVLRNTAHFISISLPGFGRSSRNPDNSYDTLILDIQQLIQFLGKTDTEIVVIGNSVGGLMANMFAGGFYIDHKLKIKQVQFLCPSAPAYVDADFPLNIDAFYSEWLMTAFAWYAYKDPITTYRIVGADDCIYWEPKRVKALVADAKRCGKYTTRGFYDNLKLVHSPLDWPYKNGGEQIYIAVGKEDTTCGEKHQEWYMDRYGVGSHEALYNFLDGGHCDCQRHFEDVVLKGFAVLP